MFFSFSHDSSNYCAFVVGLIVVWHNLHASSEPSLAFFNQRNVFAKLLLYICPLS